MSAIWGYAENISSLRALRLGPKPDHRPNEIGNGERCTSAVPTNPLRCTAYWRRCSNCARGDDDGSVLFETVPFERAEALVARLRERAVATNNARSVPAETIKDYWDGSLTPGVAQGQDEGLLLDRPVNVPVPSTSMRSAQLSPVPPALFLL